MGSLPTGYNGLSGIGLDRSFWTLDLPRSDKTSWLLASNMFLLSILSSFSNVPGLDLHMSFSQSSGCEGYEPRLRVTLPRVLLEYSDLSDLYLEQTIRKRSLKLV